MIGILRVAAGETPAAIFADVELSRNRRRIGLAEAIYLLQSISGRMN